METFATCTYCKSSKAWKVTIDHAQYQGWNIGVEHRNIFHPHEPILLVRLTRLCNKYINTMAECRSGRKCIAVK